MTGVSLFEPSPRPGSRQKMEMPGLQFEIRNSRFVANSPAGFGSRAAGLRKEP